MKYSAINSVFLFLLLFSFAVHAEELKPLPRAASLSIEGFNDIATPVNRDVEVDPGVSFSMRVIDDWQEQPSDSLKNYMINDVMYGDIASFVAPPHSLGRPYIVVRSDEIHHRLHLKHWVINEILKKGYTLRGLKEHDNGVVEALYILYEDGTTYIARSKYMINGPRIVSVSFYLPSSRYKEFRDVQIRTIEQFDFSVKDESVAEELRTYAYLDRRKFDYPESLKTEGDKEISDKEMRLFLLATNEAGYRKGVYDLYIRKKTKDFNVKQAVEAQMNYYNKSGLERGALLEKQDYALPEFMDFTSVEVYGMSNKGAGYDKEEANPITQELWIAVMSDPEYFYIFSMVGTARDVDIINWSRNAKAFEIILTTLRKTESF